MSGICTGNRRHTCTQEEKDHIDRILMRKHERDKRNGRKKWRKEMCRSNVGTMLQSIDISTFFVENWYLSPYLFWVVYSVVCSSFRLCLCLLFYPQFSHSVSFIKLLFSCRITETESTTTERNKVISITRKIKTQYTRNERSERER